MLSVITFTVSFITGAFAFAQIIGTFQNLGAFHPVHSFFLVVLWSGILAGVFFLLRRVFPAAVTGIWIGYAVSLIMVSAAGRIH